MRSTNLLRQVGFVLAGLFAACGGGGGGGSLGGSGGGGGSIPTPDAALTQSMGNVLVNAINPDGALTNLAAEVSRIYGEIPDLNLASDTVTQAWLAALKNGGDFQALLQGCLNVGSGVNIQVTTSDTCSAGGTIIPVNGIMTPYADAVNNREKLWRVLQRMNNPNTPSCAVKFFYNKSGLESASIGTFCHVFGLTGGFLPNWQAAHERTCVSGLGLIADLSESKLQWFAEMQHHPSLLDLDVVALRQQIRGELLKSKVVILVPHSQGNFFVEAAVDGLPAVSRKYVGVLAVASPANYPNQSSYGSFRHYTLDNDAILAVSTALPANGSNDISRLSSPDGFEIHSFTASYLGFQESQVALMDLFNAMAGELAAIAAGSGGGGGFGEIIPVVVPR